MYFILDAQGNPQRVDDVLTWGRWFETSPRHVALTEFGDITVSTVFLGLDHSFGLHGGPPVLWETMIFGGKYDQFQERYTSLSAAKDGHGRACTRVRTAL